MKILLFVLLCIFGSFFLSFFWWLFYFRCIKKIIPIPSELESFKQHGFLRKIFIDLPARFVLDRLTLDPNQFESEGGLVLFAGCQGSGKTIALVEYLLRQQSIYPKLKVFSNFGYKYENASLDDWKQLTLNTNGIYGEIDAIDEIQNWFSSNASKNFPEEMLSIICQQRKVKRTIVATSQVFTRISKPLREQTAVLCLPLTVFGCLTWVRMYRPLLDSEGNLKDKKLIKSYFFVHDQKIREAFDTYRTVQSLSKSGFIDKKNE